MTILSDDADYAAAMSLTRRWVAKVDQVLPEYNLKVRVAYSDTAHVWHEVPQRLGIDEYHCAIAPLEDRSALVVYAAGRSGLAWARLEDTTWVQFGVLDPRPFVSVHPRFRLRPRGGWWMIWEDDDWVHLYSYVDGAWSSVDSTHAAHPVGEAFLPGWGEVSHDSSERFPVAWMDIGAGRNAVSVALPGEGGWQVGEQLPGSGGVFPSPTITEDANGDVWVAWRVIYTGTVLLTHTYTGAKVESLWVVHEPRALRVRWRLSEPAPGSWWTLLRARPADTAEEVARIRSGPSAEGEWVDTAAPLQGVVRYRLRRECVDTRYRLESPSAQWPSRGRQVTLLPPTPMPSSREIVMEMADAAPGPIEVLIYDIQGRVVRRERLVSPGQGRDVVRMDLEAGAEMRSGIYFVRAVDARSQPSNTVKVVIVR